MSCRRWLACAATLLLGLTTVAVAQGDGDPFTGPEVEVCGPEVPFDPLGIGCGRCDVQVPTIDGDRLLVPISYGCGCATHFFGGCWSGEFSSSTPVETDLRVAHDDNDEGCELACMGLRRLDLTPISDAYHELYGPDPGVVLINLHGWPEPIEYDFAADPMPVESTTWARIKVLFRVSRPGT